MTIPFLCVDDFFNEPDEVRDFALSLDYQPPTNNQNFPGERTLPLHRINKEFFQLTCRKFLTLLYPNEVGWTCNMMFQKIYPYNYSNPSSLLNTGWPHLDNDSMCAGVIYLNDNYENTHGTTILSPKKDSTDLKYGANYSLRNTLYHGGEVSEEEYAKQLTAWNDKFDESFTIKNKYNRLIAYNRETWHKETNFYSDQNFRLTLVFFFKLITSDSHPLHRMKAI